MLEFIEKESFVCPGAFAPATKQTFIPVFMVKDGLESFVANLPIAGGNHTPEYHRQEMERYKSQLRATDGRYFKFHGLYDDPEEMLAEMIERGHTFETKPDRIFSEITDEYYGAGFVDFHGNRREVSAAFQYRVYDRGYADKLREIAKPAMKRRR